MIKLFKNSNLSFKDHLKGCINSARYKINRKSVMFFTFQRSYTCNPKYICEEIIRRNLPWKLVWVCDKKNKDSFPEAVIPVERYTPEFYRELNEAHILVDNATNVSRAAFAKKKDQFVIETMHGSLGLKRIDDSGVTTKERENRMHRTASLTDVCISNSIFENEVYKTSYWEKTPIWLYGHARNDIFFEDDYSKVKKKVYEKLSIPPEEKLVLYAPTFRPYETNDVIDAELVVQCCEEKFGGKFRFVERRHPAAKKHKYVIHAENAVDATAFEDMQELMVCCDVGITDYSSWICDYVLLRRPAFLYVPDLKKYDQAKGFYYPLSETPFGIAETMEGLSEKIRSFDRDAYHREVDRFLDERGCMDDGHAAERIVDEMVKLMT